MRWRGAQRLGLRSGEGVELEQNGSVMLNTCSGEGRKSLVLVERSHAKAGLAIICSFPLSLLAGGLR